MFSLESSAEGVYFNKLKDDYGGIEYKWYSLSLDGSSFLLLVYLGVACVWCALNETSDDR
jgi:hypothetical protein